MKSRFSLLTGILCCLLLINKVDAQLGTPTEYYCYSNNDLFILPIGVASNCDEARCMFVYYFQATHRPLDNNRVFCGQVVTTNGSYTELTAPWCPTTEARGAKVEIFKDENFTNGDAGGEGVMQFGAGQGLTCMNTTPRRNHSFWGEVFGGFFDQGPPVRNDEITSIRVPKGLKITCWMDCDHHGASIVFTENCPNVGPIWNDKISSFIVEENIPTATVTKNMSELGNAALANNVYLPPAENKTLNFDGFPFRLKNEATQTYLNIEKKPNGYVDCSAIQSGWSSAIWKAKQTDGDINVFKNTWTDGIFSLNPAPLSSSAIETLYTTQTASFAWNKPNSMWVVQFIGTSKTRCTIKNLLNNAYLTMSPGFLSCINIAGLRESVWIIEPL